MTIPRLLVLTDRRQLPEGRRLVDSVARCAEAGATVVVLRELDLGERERADLAAALATHVLVVSARAVLAGACGVHLASHQRLAEAGGLRHGRSCHSAGDVTRAAGERASWATVSPFAATASKPGYGPPLGMAGIRRAVDAAGDMPVFALGGVDASSVAGLRGAGAHGIAVMGGVMRADDPAGVVTRLLAELGER